MAEPFSGRPYAARQFRTIVAWAREHNSFYRRWITDPDNVPILDRKTCMENNDEILAGNPVTAHTSGSTGIPIRASVSRELAAIMKRDTQQFVRSLGGPLSCARIVYLHLKTPPPDTLSITEPVEAQIAFIQRRRAEAGVQAVTTFPTNAELLCRAVLEQEIDMSYIVRFGLYGETIEQSQIDLIRRAFPNARVWSTYSSNEFSLIATMCPFENGYQHIMAHRLGVEVVRDDGAQADQGETGRIIITDFLNRQSPFIRYEIGDLGALSPCPCGRIRTPAFSVLHGKVRGALLHRNGKRAIFVDLSTSLRDIPGMKQYQVVQETLERFAVSVVCDRPIDAEVTEAFRGHFGYVPHELTVRYVDAINRGPGGKFHASICHI